MKLKIYALMGFLALALTACSESPNMASTNLSQGYNSGYNLNNGMNPNFIRPMAVNPGLPNSSMIWQNTAAPGQVYYPTIPGTTYYRCMCILGPCPCSRTVWQQCRTKRSERRRNRNHSTSDRADPSVDQSVDPSDDAPTTDDTPPADDPNEDPVNNETVKKAPKGPKPFDIQITDKDAEALYVRMIDAKEFEDASDKNKVIRIGSNVICSKHKKKAKDFSCTIWVLKDGSVEPSAPENKGDEVVESNTNSMNVSIDMIGYSSQNLQIDRQNSKVAILTLKDDLYHTQLKALFNSADFTKDANDPSVAVGKNMKIREITDHNGTHLEGELRLTVVDGKIIETSQWQ